MQITPAVFLRISYASYFCLAMEEKLEFYTANFLHSHSICGGMMGKFSLCPGIIQCFFSCFLRRRMWATFAIKKKKIQRKRVETAQINRRFQK